MEGERERKYLYVMKAFAIYSVVCAHTAVEPENAPGSIRLIIRFLSAAGTMGVPIFFLVAGYLYHSDTRKFWDFAIRKCKTILMPWFFCETAVWAYVVLRKGDVSFGAWLKFIVGINHSTYFLTMLLLMYGIFWRLRRHGAALIGSIAISCCCIACTGWGVPFAIGLNRLTVTPYLNVFHWMAYFTCGMLLKKKHCLAALAGFAKRILPVSIPLLALDFYVHVRYALPWTYFSKYALLNIPLQMLVVMGISYWLSKRNGRMLETVGRYSFSIYLLHELGTGTVVWLTAKTGSSVLIWARPLVVILAVMLGIGLVEALCARFAVKDIPKTLIGIR